VASDIQAQSLEGAAQPGLVGRDAGAPRPGQAGLELANGLAGEIETCWNKIGVYGNGSCEELTEFVHCRNCPVYSHAGAQLLNRSLPPEYRREWTEHFAREKVRRTAAKHSALLFRISNEWLGLPTHAFQEVAERRLIHSLPHRRQAIVLGLANVRGELIICVSLGRLLGVEKVMARQTARQVYDRLLVANWDGQRLAFPVDEVYGIHRFEPQQLKQLPETVARSSDTFSRGILQLHQRAIGFLDAELLFSTLNRSLT
jgi:chemotaxis-related protein WspD